MKFRIVKVGGSLLELEDLPQRVMDWRGQWLDCIDLLVVGGGNAVDGLRDDCSNRLLRDEAAHWQAIEIMDGNTRWLANQLNGVSIWNMNSIVEKLPGCPGMYAIEVGEFLKDYESRHRGNKLPIGWSVTSDSIAARIATIVGADELHLLKSRLPKTLESSSLDSLVVLKYVDQEFPAQVHFIPETVAWDFRSQPARCMVLPSSTQQNGQALVEEN